MDLLYQPPAERAITSSNSSSRARGMGGGAERILERILRGLPPLTQDQRRALHSLIDFMRSNLSGSARTNGTNNSNGGGLFMLLEGSAGTGKTFLMQLLVRYNNALGPSKLRLLGAALTHKARKVLQRSLNYAGSMSVVPTKTISALLKKQRLNSYLGAKKYGAGGNGLVDYDLVIIDECSMIDDRDLQQLVAGARAHRTKLLFVGDRAQIPHPTQQLALIREPSERSDPSDPSEPSSAPILVKADSAAFRLRNRAELKQIVRQKEGNPLLIVARHIRENLFCSEVTGPYEHEDRLQGQERQEQGKEQSRPLQGIRFVRPTDFEYLIISEFRRWPQWSTPYEARIIAYTNQAVQAYNRLARNARFSGFSGEGEDTGAIMVRSASAGAGEANWDEMPIAPGDLLMGYANIGWPTPYIENGQDYLVTAVRYEDAHGIALDGGKIVESPGYLVTFGEADPDGMMRPLPGTITTQFFPIPEDPRNLGIFMELRTRAGRVNQPNSGSKVYKHYRELKDQLLFMESLYEFAGRIWAESDFKREHPLLSTKICELILEEDGGPPSTAIAREVAPGGVGRRAIRSETKLYRQVAEAYPGLVEERALNRHMLGPGEEFGDRFLIIDKDMDYGYAVTAHKSQGSTYDRVYIDDVDLSKIRDHWNYEHGTYYRASKERNQLKYVAVTRARNLVTVLSSQIPEVPISLSCDEAPGTIPESDGVSGVSNENGNENGNDNRIRAIGYDWQDGSDIFSF